jgi:hypothetical protein
MVSEEEFDAAIKEYDENYLVYRDLRLGQYLMNTLVPTVTDPEIFYEFENPRARILFYTKYVENDSITLL